MALFSSAADTFVFSFPIRRFLFRESRSTTEMLPAQEAWRISGEGLFTEVRGKRILRTSPLRHSTKFSNHAEPGRRQGFFGAPAFILSLAALFSMYPIPRF